MTYPSGLIITPEPRLSTSYVFKYESKKCKIWHRCYLGHSKIVIGARSSLFLPFANSEAASKCLWVGMIRCDFLDIYKLFV